MVKYGVVGTITDLEDNVLQNDIDLDSYKAANKSLEGIPLKEHPLFKGKKAVAIEKMPGYEVLIGNIWFGAAWKMWFSDSYYDYISKDSIKNFSECYSNEQIADTCRCITLYENTRDYDAPQSRERQWKFKEAIDFQNTVNRLKKKRYLIQ